MKKNYLFLLILMVASLKATSQKIVYSEPGKNDTRRMNFEIIGKIKSNFLIYKELRGRTYIAVLDNDMNTVATEEQKYMPNNDRLINIDFFPYNDFTYGIYQYQKKNIVHCMVVKIDETGKKIGDPIELDTTKIGFAANNKIYTALSSEDKNQLIVFKINTKNKRNYRFTSLLLNQELQLIKKTMLQIPMDDRDESIGEFQLDNEGDLVFSKFTSKNSDQISNAAFVVKYANADTLAYHPLNLDKLNLDEIRIKVDNFNKKYLLTSFFFKERRGNIDGYYFYVWDKTTQLPSIENTVSFSDEFRKEAKGNAGTRTAFNDYFIRHIISRKDGGFLIASEAYYTSSRLGNWNRWHHLNSPYISRFDYYSYSPFYRNSWGLNRWSDNNMNSSVRHLSDNIAISSFDKQGNLEWNSVIVKKQFDDLSDGLLSFQLMNTGGQLHFLFNQQEKRIQLLTDYTLSANGEIKRSPTLKLLDKGYEFIPRYARQVSGKQIIVPCFTRNYICFAKIEYN